MNNSKSLGKKKGPLAMQLAREAAERKRNSANADMEILSHYKTKKRNKERI